MTKGNIVKKMPLFWVKNSLIKGNVDIGHKEIPHARSYLWMYYKGKQLPDDPEDWKLSHASTQARSMTKNLKSGVYYWFRCCGVTPSGMTKWCEPILLMVF